MAENAITSKIKKSKQNKVGNLKIMITLACDVFKVEYKIADFKAVFYA